MKKALFALGLLAFAILPGCGGDGCKDCDRKEVQVRSYGKSVHTQAIEEPILPADEYEFTEDDGYEL